MLWSSDQKSVFCKFNEPTCELASCIAMVPFKHKQHCRQNGLQLLTLRFPLLIAPTFDCGWMRSHGSIFSVHNSEKLCVHTPLHFGLEAASPAALPHGHPAW